MPTLRHVACTVLLAAVCLSSAAATSGGLQEAPVLGDGPVPFLSLDGEGWTAANADGTIVVGATVPGDLISDLQRANVIDDPLFNVTFQGKLWDLSRWTYTSPAFRAPDLTASQEVFLVFDGIKMAADVAVNGQYVGTFSDQFLRQILPVQHLLQPGDTNVLTVTFRTSGDAMNNETRWMGCSGGWDWAPYSTTNYTDGTRTFTKGIVKSVYLVPVQTAAVASIVPQVRYTGIYPRAPLTDDSAAPFSVTVRVHLLCPTAGCDGRVTINASWAPSAAPATAVVMTANGSNTYVDVTLPDAKGVELWWPNGMGSQRQYTLSVAYQGPSFAVAATRQVGFRALFLITTNETADDATKDGSGNFTMRYKVNGADVYLRGANMIPMEELDARQSAAAYRALVDSAADAHFNILRIWGGGIFLPPAFYDRCDERGVLLFHDMMYGQPWNAQGGSGGTPKAGDMQRAELQFNIRNLAHHVSIATWNGGNEWQGGLDLWTSFVMPTIVAEDATRPIWPTSPSIGFLTGVNSLTGLPNGNPLTAMHAWNSPIETHGPYQHGSGFQTVNSDGALVPFPPNMPPVLLDHAVSGAHVPGVFATEFGCSVFSSFESMSPTLPEPDWAPHAPVMYQRNYACDSIVAMYFGPQRDLNTTTGSAAVLRKATYLCMVGQALEMQSDIEHRRSGNTFGTVVWQLNEIWPTGGWGSVEYGTVGWTPGQVLGGRWKPIHHFMRQHLYNDHIAVCGASALCYVKNDDALAGLTARWTATLVDLATGAATPVAAVTLTLPRGAGALAWLCAATGLPPPTAGAACPGYASIVQSVSANASSPLLLTNTVLRIALQRAADGSRLDANDVYMVPFAQIVASSTFRTAADVAFRVHRTPDAAGRYAVTLDVAGTSAFFVTLTTAAHGHFDRNAFLVTPAESPATVFFEPSAHAAFDVDVLADSTRVEHAAQYVAQA